MTKAELVQEITKSANLTKEEVLAVVEALMNTVKDSLANGEAVYLRGFGCFYNKKRAAKNGRNITKGTVVHIPEHYIPAFKAYPDFTDKLK